MSDVMTQAEIDRLLAQYKDDDNVMEPNVRQSKKRVITEQVP